MNSVIIIPARMGSTRLHGKPLADINGKAMIMHVYDRATEANIGDVYVATDDEHIFDIVTNYGGKAVMTSADHQSGSDRIWQALELIDKSKNYEYIVNLQGDLPTIEPELIKMVLEPLKTNHNIDITTLACRIETKADRLDPNIVKPVVAWNENNTQGKALYFTRCSAPYSANNDGDLYHHIGIYAYRRDGLKKFVSLKPSPLENREKLEQLRALENNMHIEVVKVDTVPIGVDTEKQLNEAREYLK